MIFASPLWLLALVPIAAVVLYLLWGRRRQEPVPFLDLWLAPVKGPRPKRRFATPPLALALAILAMLLAILGAARPGLWDSNSSAPLTIVVDRGATMSARDRFNSTSHALDQALAVLGESTPVSLYIVPGGGQPSDLHNWTDRVAQRSPTAVDTTAALRAIIADRLAQTTTPIIVITDRDLGVDNDRLVRAAPQASVRNAGITLVAARETPRPQVMVRVRNDSDAAQTELRVSSAGRDVTRTIDLPPCGAEPRDYSIDLERFGDVIEMKLTSPDDFPADNAAWLVREGSPPLLELRAPLPAELRLMIDVYTASRPPATDAAPVAIVRDPSALPPNSPGVVLAEARDTSPASDVQVRPHPITRDTRWSFREPVRLAPPPPGPGWATLVSVAGRVAVGVREMPARQVWVGIDSEEWPRTPDYVVFWANVFDGFGRGETRFVAQSAATLGKNWRVVEMAGAGDTSTGPSSADAAGLWPGLYERIEDGALRAVNAGDVRFPSPPAADWRPRLRERIIHHARSAARPLSPAVFLAAVASAAVAVAAWKGQRRHHTNHPGSARGSEPFSCPDTPSHLPSPKRGREDVARHLDAC